jgi:propanediol dehydratase large subunit
MGFHEKKSMLYLEARCLCLQRGMGVQGTQNGGIDGAPLAASVPGGLLEILAENVLAAWLDLECASGNDTRFTESEIRVGAKIMPLLMSGTDYICSGFGSVQAYDNSFNASLFNGEEFEDFLAIQRDYLIDGGLSHVAEDRILEGRDRAISALTAVLEELDLTALGNSQKESVLYASGSAETDSLTPGKIATLNETMQARGITILEVIRALAKRGFETEAERLVMMLRHRVAGDYLQTSAFIRNGEVISAVNDANHYLGPGSGYRVSEARRSEIAAMRDTVSGTDVLHQETRPNREETRRYSLVPRGIASKERDARQVVIGVSPAFGTKIHRTTAGLPHSQVIRRLIAGIEEVGGKARIVRMMHTADTSFLGLSAARISGSGIGIGLQAKGTTVIHKADLAPHMNLELFSMAPLITEDDYHAIGRNAALYAQRKSPEPISVPYGGQALGARFHVRTALLHAIDTEMTDPEAEPQNVEVRFHDS